MKKLINDPNDVVTEALHGIEAAHPELNVDHQHKVIYRGDAPKRGKVGIVSGGGSGVPGPVAQIPGMYTAEDPAFTYSIWGGSDPGYTMPGPAVWVGGGSSASSSDSSSSSGASTESSGNTTGGEMTANAPTTSTNTQNTGSWGTASDETTTTETKPECEVQYIGGGSARRAVRA